MNCAECRENLVAAVEESLEPEVSRQHEAHLEGCAECRAASVSVRRLQERLIASGRAAAQVSIVEPVMLRIRRSQTQPRKDTLLSRMMRGWGLGLSAASAGAAVLLALFLLLPQGQAKASEVLARGAKALAKLTSLHLVGRMRTLPGDNFSLIAPEQDLSPVELWVQLDPILKWRVEKPGRVAAMNGQSSVLFLKEANVAVNAGPSRGTFDTEWLLRIAALSTTLTDELNEAHARGWRLTLAHERAADGREKSIVSVEAHSGLPQNDHLKNRFFDQADTRRVYRFDAQTDRLEEVQIYLSTQTGGVLLFEIKEIEYDRQLDSGVFELTLPSNVGWYQEPENQSDSQKYAAMSAAQAARAFFEACGREDWSEVARFWPMPLNDQGRRLLGGIQIVSLGEPSGSSVYSVQFVPYVIKLKDGTVKTHQLALKRNPRTGLWIVDGGM